MFLTQVDLAHQWRLLDHTFDPRLAPRVAELVLSSDALAECNQRLWQPILADYQDAGVVRVDLDLNQTVRWMTYQAVWFLSHPDALTADPEERRSYVRTFLVSGMLA